MKKRKGKLFAYLRKHLAGIGIGAVTVGMAVTVVKGAAGQGSGFDPSGIRTSFSSELSALPDRTGYDLSGQGEDSEEIDRDAGREPEAKEEEQEDLEELTQEAKEELEDEANLGLNEEDEPFNEQNEQIILPDELLDLPRMQDFLSEMVSKEDEEILGNDAGSLQGGLGESGVPVNSSSGVNDAERGSLSGGRAPSNAGGTKLPGENEMPGTETNRPPEGDKNPSGPEGDKQPGGEQKPGGAEEGNPPGGNEEGPVEVPGGDTPPGGNEGVETPPDGGSISIVIGGKEEVFKNEDDALAWIADRYGEDENGKLFEGLIKDENGNYTPSYADKDKFNGNGDVAYDYIGDSGVFVVPSGATSLDGAFASSLAKEKTKTIVIPKAVDWIDSSDFYFPVLEKFVVSADNPVYVSVDGALYARREDGNLKLVIMPAAKKEVGQWSDSLTEVGKNAFAYSCLNTVELPESVETIGESAFRESTVETIILPEGLKKIDDFAFMFAGPKEDEGLLRHRIMVRAGEPPVITNLTFRWMDSALDKGQSEPVTEIIVPDSAEDRVYEAYLETWGKVLAKQYSGEAALKLLKTELGAQNQYTCFTINGNWYFKKKDSDSLDSYEDNLGVYRLNEEGEVILIACQSKEAVVDFSKSGIVEMEEGAFADCPSMIAVKLPESLRIMPENVFADNPALKVVISYAPVPPAEVTGMPQSCAVFVRPEALHGYQTAWGGQARRILGTDDTYTLLSSGIVFDQASKRLIDVPADLETLSLPSYITAIAEDAARDNTALKSVSITAKVSAVGEGAFAGCTGLTTVNWLTSAAVPDSCFAGCKALKTFRASSSSEAGHNLTAIGNRAFYECSALETVLYYSYPLNGSNYYYYYFLKEIGEEAFYGCTSMTYAYLHSSVEYVGERAFEGSGLVSMYWYTAAAVPDFCFADNQAMQTVGWGNGLTELIGDGAFYGCTGLKELPLPLKLSQIGSQAFDGRDGKALVLHFNGKTPPQWAGPETMNEFTLYVPDSKEEDDAVYRAYWEAWADWLGEEPGYVLKTKDGAENRVPATDKDVEPEPVPDVEQKPEADEEAETEPSLKEEEEDKADSDPEAEPEDKDESDLEAEPEDEAEPDFGAETEDKGESDLEAEPEDETAPDLEADAEEEVESAPDGEPDAKDDLNQDLNQAPNQGDDSGADIDPEGDAAKPEDKEDEYFEDKEDEYFDEGEKPEDDSEEMNIPESCDTEVGNIDQEGSIPENAERKEEVNGDDYQAVGTGDEGSREGADR